MLGASNPFRRSASTAGGRSRRRRWDRGFIVVLALNMLCWGGMALLLAWLL